jgi:hypothetical protein
MRKRAAGLKTYKINMNLTHPLTLCRTCEATAVPEVHTLHAFGEHDLADVTCEKEGKEREEEG